MYLHHMLHRESGFDQLERKALTSKSGGVSKWGGVLHCHTGENSKFFRRVPMDLRTTKEKIQCPGLSGEDFKGRKRLKGKWHNQVIPNPIKCTYFEKNKKPTRRQLFSPDQVKSKGKSKMDPPLKEEEMMINDFDLGLKDDFVVICNVVCVLPIEYDCVTEVSDQVDYDKKRW